MQSHASYVAHRVNVGVLTQMLGLFFASMASRALELASALWGKLANLISFDFNFVAPSINPLVVYILIGVVAFILLVCFAVFMCMASSKQPDALRQGHEAELWDEQAEKYKKTVKFLRFFLTGCFSVCECRAPVPTPPLGCFLLGRSLCGGSCATCRFTRVAHCVPNPGVRSYHGSHAGACGPQPWLCSPRYRHCV